MSSGGYMVGQGIQKHNPDLIDEGYIASSPTPTNFEDGAIDEPEDEGTSDHNVPNKTPIDERYTSFIGVLQMSLRMNLIAIY
ncbi:hypothetical protein [Wolbachia endosymbiont (group A) of Colletes cunicularius]|uniref:hypothetical protein n=1 Tax=Wolbachia endosymbiont (group A) of Colletes cunicularius TaxID=3139321 RepID=UPI0035C930C4